MYLPLIISNLIISHLTLGQWKANMRHGSGCLLERDGSIYQGKFFENRKHGAGCIQYANGTTYTGVWEYNQIRGSGSVNLPIGDTPYGGPKEVCSDAY